jgi:hypothetical protein
MRGILADVNVERHLQILAGLLRSDPRRELWSALSLECFAFSDFDLDSEISDRELWEWCQQAQIILLTLNRNQKGTDSLEEAIRMLNTPESLPVMTIGSGRRFMEEPTYRNQCADRCLEFLYDMENLRGTGRLYLP